MSEHIGERIRKLRYERGMAATDLAKSVSVNRATVSHWEHGRCRPDARRLPLIASALDVSIDTLMTGCADAGVSAHDTTEASRALLDAITKWAPKGEGGVCESMARAYAILAGCRVTP